MTEKGKDQNNSSQKAISAGLPDVTRLRDLPVPYLDRFSFQRGISVSDDDDMKKPQMCGSCKTDTQSWLDSFNETIDGQVKKDLPHVSEKEREKEKHIRFMDMYQEHIRSIREENSGKEKITNTTEYVIRNGEVGIEDTYGHFITLEEAFIGRMETHGKFDGSAQTLRLAAAKMIESETAEVFLPVHNEENGRQKIRFVSRWWREGDTVKSEMIRMEGADKSLGETREWMEEHIAHGEKSECIDLSKGVILFANEGNQREISSTDGIPNNEEKVYSHSYERVKIGVPEEKRPLKWNEGNVSMPFIIGNQMFHAVRETRESIRVWKQNKCKSTDMKQKGRVEKIRTKDRREKKYIDRRASSERRVRGKLLKVEKKIFQGQNDVLRKHEKRMKVKERRKMIFLGKDAINGIPIISEKIRIYKGKIENHLRKKGNTLMLSEKQQVIPRPYENKKQVVRKERKIEDKRETKENSFRIFGKHMEKKLRRIFVARLKENMTRKENMNSRPKEVKKNAEKIANVFVKFMKQIYLLSSFFSEQKSHTVTEKGTNEIQSFSEGKIRVKDALCRLFFAIRIWQIFHLFDQYPECTKIIEKMQVGTQKGQIGEHTAIEENFVRPWILLAIIWQMDMVREGGLSMYVQKSKKKKKRAKKRAVKSKNKKHTFSRVMPTHGVIYAYPTL